jgi:hypothetical protein
LGKISPHGNISHWYWGRKCGKRGEIKEENMNKTGKIRTIKRIIGK